MRQTTVQYLAFDRVKLLDDRTAQAFGKRHQVVKEMTPMIALQQIGIQCGAPVYDS